MKGDECDPIFTLTIIPVSEMFWRKDMVVNRN